jgi:hypothetical protein
MTIARPMMNTGGDGVNTASRTDLKASMAKTTAEAGSPVTEEAVQQVKYKL